MDASRLTIFVDGDDVPINDALQKINEDWILQGNYSIKTFEDLVRSIRVLYNDNGNLARACLDYKKELDWLNGRINERTDGVCGIHKDLNPLNEWLTSYFKTR